MVRRWRFLRNVASCISASSVQHIADLHSKLGQMSKVKDTRDKNDIFRPFRRPACGLCLV